MKDRNFQAFVILIFVGVISCGGLATISGCEKLKKAKKPTNTIILATTTSTQDSGLLDEILPHFEKKYGVKVKTIALGTGEAIAMGERGEADVILVHSREAEDEFVQKGYGKKREDVMYNHFVIVGPPSDPAVIKELSPELALAKIASAQAKFISRGDESGTDKKEEKLWQYAGVTPQGNWYSESGQGMGETLRIAEEKQAYTLTDLATYLTQKDNISLKVLVERDRVLSNSYGVITVNPDKFSQVNYKDAQRFINWITSYEVQKEIGNFGKEEYGRFLFIPNSSEWKSSCPE